MTRAFEAAEKCLGVVWSCRPIWDAGILPLSYARKYNIENNLPYTSRVF